MRFRVQLIDPGFKRHIRSYFFQSLLATFILFAVLLMKDALAQGAIIAAIGSSAFVLFIMPHSRTASPRHVLGGHLIGMVLGGAVSVLDNTAVGQDVLANVPMAFEIFAAAAVGLGCTGDRRCG